MRSVLMLVLSLSSIVGMTIVFTWFIRRLRAIEADKWGREDASRSLLLNPVAAFSRLLRRKNTPAPPAPPADEPVP